MRIGGVSKPVDVPPGWHWMYTRGYDLATPASFAFQWFVAHAPVSVGSKAKGPSPGRHGKASEERSLPSERVVYPTHGMERVTRWEILPPDRVVFHDSVYRRGRLVLQGEERYRFVGGAESGCIVEVTTLRRPIGLVSKLGFSLFPGLAVRRRAQEAELFDQIERDHKNRGPRGPASQTG